MNYDIVEALGQIAREKGVDLQILVDRLEASLLSAAKRKHGANAQILVNFDRARGGIEMIMTKTVVGNVSDRGLEMTATEARAYKAGASVGDDIVIPLDIAEFGRNAIQSAKQVLIQGVREAERERVYTDFADRVGLVVRGVVQQIDRGNIVLKLDTAEAVIPARELMHRDRFRQREMVRALVVKVDKEARGPQVILSRTHPDFLVKLFAAEVPEIAERVVEVRAVAREAGFRSKIAVASNDPRIDAVGACVGIKGSRVQSIVKELGGERIDIVPWSQDPVVFVSRSLGPAKALDARVDHDLHKVTVVVADDQLSLAIGKQGQNVRLAHKLTGWKIELHAESEFRAKTAAAEADVPIEDFEGMNEALAGALHAAGVDTALDIESGVSRGWPRWRASPRARPSGSTAWRLPRWPTRGRPPRRTRSPRMARRRSRGTRSSRRSRPRGKRSPRRTRRWSRTPGRRRNRRPTSRRPRRRTKTRARAKRTVRIAPRRRSRLRLDASLEAAPSRSCT